ncbi:uncharacterized protein LOC124457977 [Xenia sp. Carnegie-2017]|uniref:uncharacterized protein LOC124457977 n=1 Tax=Xenia sp. Carnegie-2017 TaxID=2897299 RepID=UPI001F04FEFD|nr:uncharacterized protein LOC124457977 [Xenia sp. Carnegie-2017]
MPSTSSSAERSFSALKRIKTYLRSTQGQERLSAFTTISIEMEMLFDSAGTLSNTSDELLKACGIKGGQVIRIKNALATINNLDKLLPVRNVLSTIEPSTQKIALSTSNFFAINNNVSNSSASIEEAHLSTGTPTPTTSSTPRHTIASDKSDQPSPNFVLVEGRKLNKNWIKDFKLPISFSSMVNETLQAGKLNGKLRDEFTRDICSSIKAHTMFPSREEKQRLASMTVEKYTFLVPSLGAGTGSWLKAITNRLKTCV